MKYKYARQVEYVRWLKLGEIYEAEMVVSPVELSGGIYLLINKADDGFPCYAPRSWFDKA
jgi:hypothetical protein